MIVVRTEGDVAVVQLRIGTWDDSDDIVSELCPNDVVVGIEVDSDRDSVEREDGQRFLCVAQAFELRVVDRRMTGQEVEERISGRDGRWDCGVEPLNGRE